MAIKNVYLYKVIIIETSSGKEVDVSRFKVEFQKIFDKNIRNRALKLTKDASEPVVLDVIENTDKYLFARLSKKRPNNSMQKRDYTTYETTDVLDPSEADNSGVEWFTYCILGYSHGILSVVNSKGAPGGNTLARIFSLYNASLSLEIERIPNKNLINELLDGGSPEINKIEVGIAQPSSQIMQDVFGFSEQKILQEMHLNTSSIIFEIKPVHSGYLLDNSNNIKKIIRKLMKNRKNYSSVKVSGKAETGERQKEYDLYEEYFKYSISINEYYQEDGRKVEVKKNIIEEDYKTKIMGVYNEFKKMILAVSNR